MDAIGEAVEPPWARITVFVLTGLFVSVIALMFLTKIDRVVTSMAGKLVSMQRINVFQALDPSIIKTIDVHEGDEVEQGQLLATLDPTFAAADVKQLRLQVAGLQAQIERDEAQLNDRPFVFPESADSEIRQTASMQREYYNQQTAQYKAQLASYNAKINQTQATILKYQTDASRYQQREQIAQQIENMHNMLVAQHAGSLLNALTSEDQRLEVLRTLEFDHNSLIESQHTLASITADRDAFIQQWSTQLSQDLATAQGNLDTAQASLEKATRHHELVRLTAMERSVVLTVAALSVGSVLKEGDTLFTLMPDDSIVEAEIHISPRDVGFIRPGDRCVLKIDSFNYMEHGTAEGKIRWISDNAFTYDDNNQPVDAYYKARCTIDAMHFVHVPPKFRLIPGMTLEADVNVGTRSVAMYLLGGLLRGFGESMREP
ncbi:MAG: HlyD family type I secretion periplasmic adaptor subunit [Xanthobacteraceae bacterium]